MSPMKIGGSHQLPHSNMAIADKSCENPGGETHFQIFRTQEESRRKSGANLSPWLRLVHGKLRPHFDHSLNGSPPFYLVSLDLK